MDLGLKMVLGVWYRDSERGFDIMIQEKHAQTSERRIMLWGIAHVQGTVENAWYT